jgi:LmbE family N-acetylglucosaminyl deacetylase
VSDPGPGDHLPPWRSVLAVVAHPDDESFGLGAVLAGFADAGAAVAVLCFTHGESSTLHGVQGDLASLRAAELSGAARVLGVGPVRLVDYPDGALTGVDVDDLSAHVLNLAGEVGADGLLVFDTDGVTGHPDHARATLAALAAADSAELTVLGWTVPQRVAAALNKEYDTAFTGHDPQDIDLVVTLDRTRQCAAVARHPSQAVPGSLLWRRLDLLGEIEYLRWLRRPHHHHKDGTSS